MEIQLGGAMETLQKEQERRRQAEIQLRQEQERRRKVEEELEVARAQLSVQQLDVTEARERNHIATTCSAHEAGSTCARTPTVVLAQPCSAKHPRTGPNFVTLSTKAGKQTVVRVTGHTLPRSTVLPRWECAITAQDANNYGSTDLAARAFIALIKSRLDELASANGNAEYSGCTVRACKILPRRAIQERWRATCASCPGYDAVRRVKRSQAEVQKYGCVGCDATPHGDVARLR